MRLTRALVGAWRRVIWAGPALALLGVLGSVTANAQVPTTPVGETTTEVAGAAVTVVDRPAPFNLTVSYHYLPGAAVLSQDSTPIDITVDAGRGLLIFADDPSDLSVRVPVSPFAQAPPGGTANATAQLPLWIYCSLPGKLTFPVGNASIVVSAEAQANGLLQSSRGATEVQVRCEGRPQAPAPSPKAPSGTPSAAAPPEGSPSPSPPRSAPTPLGGPLAILAAVAWLLRRRRDATTVPTCAGR